MINPRVFDIIESCETQEQVDHCQFIAEAAREPDDFKRVAEALAKKRLDIKFQAVVKKMEENAKEFSDDLNNIP